jgi:predicted PolB exonuclease-like 3'-5' exonuclease
MPKQDVQYFVFDIETVADGNLISNIVYSGEEISPEDAIARYREELMEQYDSDFIAHTYHLPVSVAIGKVASDFSLIDLVVLDEPKFRPHVITEHFWRGWEMYKRPTWVSFNGRGFDMPVLELAAFRYGISVPKWFNTHAKSFEQARNRYNTASHLDLQDFVTNFGATRFKGGLNLAANILGKPGKMDVAGFMVQDLYNEGKLQQINDYCRCDVLDTYFVFLRTRVLSGDLSLEQEQELIAQTKTWLEKQAPDQPAYADYLDHWGDWSPPED